MASSSYKEAYKTQGEEWSRLALLAQSGDKRAYSALLSDIYPFVKSRAASGLANPDWVEDVAQDVLISVHKSLASYSPERPFRPWLMAIIQFRKTDFLRKHYKSKKVKENTYEKVNIFSEDVTDSPNAGELKDIEAALGDIPDKQREIFLRMKVEGYSAQEVADHMDMSVSAVKVSAHRTANKLKEMLNEHE